MPFAEWSDELSIGIESIDSQHKELIEALNNLNDAYDSPNRQRAAETCLTKMKDYMREHFADEEQFMKDIDYPGIETQKREHRQFTDKVSDYDVAQISLYTPFQDMLDFLKEWFVDHIKTNDKKIADHLNGKAWE